MIRPRSFADVACTRSNSEFEDNGQEGTGCGLPQINVELDKTSIGVETYKSL
jgi:hypothetical protein